MGYLLPENIEGLSGQVCVNLRLPDDPAILRAFWGQFYELTHYWNWDRDEGTDAEAAAIAQFMKQVYFANEAANMEYACPIPRDDAPYWDDAESLAGEGAGEGEKWGFDEFADWIVTAFLATSVHPAAGLFYKTVIPKGRIAFKSHDYGALVRILIDGIFAIEVNTASSVPGVDEIIEVEIDFQQFAEAHDLPGDERTIRIERAA